MTIDVLAVMERAAGVLDESRCPMREALAAVAELIEADREYDRVFDERPVAYESNCMSNEESRALHEWRALFDKAETRRAAALANVQPASTQGDNTRVCTCSLRIKLVGDGCDVCNPEKAAEIAEDNAKGE